MTKPETPILALKDTKALSVFQPANLLREARRQRGLDHADVPELCLLDPDGDMVRYLERVGEAEQINHWACYHTKIWRFQRDGGVRRGWLRGGRRLRRACGRADVRQWLPLPVSITSPGRSRRWATLNTIS